MAGVGGCTELSASPPSQESLRRLPWCTCVSASARQSRAQCCATEFCCRILLLPTTISFPSYRRIPCLEPCRDHRVHHKCSETAADPHDASRGIFFSHMGWLLIRKSPAVLIAGNKFNPMNVLCDPVVAFQLVYHRSLVITFFFLSVMAPCLLWGERVLDAIAVAGVLRWILLLHATWSVNSLAHAYGRRPYTRSSCGPAENTLVSLLALGEGCLFCYFLPPRARLSSAVRPSSATVQAYRVFVALPHQPLSRL